MVVWQAACGVAYPGTRAAEPAEPSQLPAIDCRLPVPPPPPAARAYTQPAWLLPRALSPAIPVFLLATVYWSIGDELDAEHATSIAGRRAAARARLASQHPALAAHLCQPARLPACQPASLPLPARQPACPPASACLPLPAAVLFMVSTSCAYGSMGVLPTLVAERAVFLREVSDGLYLPITYLVHQPAA